jgi:hypothetical protein
MASQYYTPLSNGLQSFVDASPEYEFADAGIGSFREQASRLAEFGRNGDIYVVHAAEGETVIPTEVLEANPKVRELLFEQMRGMGLDPQGYIVGNELNSRNPVTGMPEFFFKSVFEGVKKAAKNVWKVAKKVAPVVLPIAAAMFGVPFLGPMFGAGTFGASFLGSGIGSLIGGASVKDSIKSGLMAGATTAAFSGLSGAFSDTGTFAGGIEGSLTGKTPVFAPGQFDQQIGTQVAASPLAESKYAFNVGGYDPKVITAGQAASDAQWDKITDWDLLGGAKSGTVFDPASGTGRAPGFVTDAPKLGDAQAQVELYNPNALWSGHPAPEVPTQDALSKRQAYLRSLTPTNKFAPGEVMEPSFLHADKLLAESYNPAMPGTDVRLPGAALPGPVGMSSDDLTTWQVAQQYTPYAEAEFTLPSGNVLRGSAAKRAADAAGQQDYLNQLPAALRGTAEGREGAIAAGRRAVADIMPTYTQQYAAPVLGGIAAWYALSDEEKEQRLASLEEERNRRNRLLQESPEDFVVSDLDTGQFSSAPPSNLIVPSAYPFRPAPRRRQVMFGNQGGLAQYPRREMLVEGPGTERSDDIPAMLSDGEFVLNARSVRGADPTGQGNRHRGAQNLYRMMRDFEMRV